MKKLTDILNKVAKAQRGGDAIIDWSETFKDIGACCTRNGCERLTRRRCYDVEGAWQGYGDPGFDPCYGPNNPCEDTGELGRCCIYTQITGGMPKFVSCQHRTARSCQDLEETSQGIIFGRFSADTSCESSPPCQFSDDWWNTQTYCCTRCTYTDFNDGTKYSECERITRRECYGRQGQDNFIPGWKCSVKEQLGNCDGCNEGVDFKDDLIDVKS